MYTLLEGAWKCCCDLTHRWLQVVLKLQPHGQENLREVTLKREKIKINPVTAQLCGSPSSSISEASPSAELPAASTGKIGYIRVATFSKQTPENARSALQKLKADGADRSALLYPWLLYQAVSAALSAEIQPCG